MENVAADIEAHELEQALCQLPAIKAARVVLDRTGSAISEIHVLALPDKSPKQLVRDIESGLMAQFGIEIDHKKISIAQLGENAIDAEVSPLGPRPRILAVDTGMRGVRATAMVSLDIDDEVYTGEAAGPASQTARSRLVAEACLDAIQQYSADSLGFAVEDVIIAKLGREQVAVACVAVVTPIGEQTYAGSAVIRGNTNESIVRATLDAINRRLGSLTSP